MTTINGSDELGSLTSQWAAVCEQEATQAADKLAKSLRQYLLQTPGQCASSATQLFGQKFVQFFLDHLESQSLSKHLANGTPHGSPVKRLVGVAGGGVIRDPHPPPLSVSSRSHTIDLGEGVVGGLSVSNPVHDDVDPPQTIKQKSLFRKISFRTLRPASKPLRHLFKQHSDEIELSHSSVSSLPTAVSTTTATSTDSHTHRKKYKHRHEKLPKMADGCKKEGVVYQLTGEDYCGKTKWEKCRLVLLNTTGGFMLEFFVPPKVN